MRRPIEENIMAPLDRVIGMALSASWPISPSSCNGLEVLEVEDWTVDDECARSKGARSPEPSVSLMMIGEANEHKSEGACSGYYDVMEP
jgi:hypothetical protein